MTAIIITAIICSTLILILGIGSWMARNAATVAGPPGPQGPQGAQGMSAPPEYPRGARRPVRDNPQA